MVASFSLFLCALGLKEFCEECDFCPNDANKTESGICGCNIPDVDSDVDGVADCLDLCPDDPDKLDPGFCGCGEPEFFSANAPAAVMRCLPPEPCHIDESDYPPDCATQASFEAFLTNASATHVKLCGTNSPYSLPRTELFGGETKIILCAVGDDCVVEPNTSLGALRAFTSATVEACDTTFQGFTENAIFFDDASGTLTNVSFLNNGGGPLFATNGGIVECTSCHFENGTFGAAGVSGDNSRLTLNGPACTFKNNNRNTGSGGGLRVTNQSTATIIGCTFFGNSAATSGQHVYVDDVLGTGATLNCNGLNSFFAPFLESDGVTFESGAFPVLCP